MINDLIRLASVWNIITIYKLNSVDGSDNDDNKLSDLRASFYDME